MGRMGNWVVPSYAVRCNAKRSALRWPMQRTATANAARCVILWKMPTYLAECFLAWRRAFLMGRASTPSKVILTGAMVPSGWNTRRSMQVSR